MPLEQHAFFAQRGTSKRLPDHVRHPVLNPVKLLELVSNGQELINAPDLPLEICEGRPLVSGTRITDGPQ
jgi:hypothetical protein